MGLKILISYLWEEIKYHQVLLDFITVKDLGSIATRFGVKQSLLAETNNIQRPDLIKLGKNLRFHSINHKAHRFHHFRPRLLNH